MKINSLHVKRFFGVWAIILIGLVFSSIFYAYESIVFPYNIIIKTLIFIVSLYGLYWIIPFISMNHENDMTTNPSATDFYFTSNIHSGFVIFSLNNDYKLLYASNGFYDIVGYNEDEVKQKYDNSLVPFILPEDYPKFMILRDGLENGNCIQREVRMVTKDGRVVWILFNGNFIIDEDGVDTISAVLVDVTESKKMHERLLLEEERYRIATEISNDILFEYEIKEDVMEYVDKYTDLYGREPSISNFTSNIRQSEEIIHPEDLGIFTEYCQALRSGKEKIECELRICDIKNKYIWCHILGKTIYDDNKNPIRVIGKMVNIDLHKKELEKLEYKAKRDPLTGVYNKVTTKEMIDHYIAKHNDKQHIFMIIDIDDFKRINDNFGHLRGDRILSFVISQVKQLFTGGEIIGRIGGDEFAVFVGGVNNIDSVIMKAKLLHHALQTVYHDGEDDISVTGSIGISMYPKDGKNYNQLLNCADKALYVVKEQGKDGYKLFN